MVAWKGFLPALGIAVHVAAAIIAIIYIVLPWIRNNFAKRGCVPGPAFWLPLIGETPQLLQSPFKYMWNCWIAYGGVFRTNLLGQQVYVVGTQDVLRSVWSDEEAFEFFVPGKTFSMLLTDIRHMREPVQHAFFRRKLGQALSPAAVAANLLGPMAEVMRRHLDEWGRRGRVELSHACEELSMDVALEVVTGHPLPPDPADRATMRRLFRTVLDGLFGLPVVLPGTAIYRALRARRRLMAMLWPLVEAEAAEIAAKARGGEGAKDDLEAEGTAADAAAAASASTGASGPPPVRMLEAQVSSALAAAAAAAESKSRSISGSTSGGVDHAGLLGSLLSPEQLFERALGTVIAVDETSRHMFFAAISATALAPGVRSRLEEEQRQAIRKYGNELSYSVLSDMPYLDAVIKETLRLLPPSIGGFRIAKRDVQLRGGVVVPRGGVVYWSTHLAHCCDPALLPRTPAPEPPARFAQAGSWFRSSASATAAASDPAAATRRALARGAAVGPTGLPAHLDFQCRFEEAFRPERWLVGGSSGVAEETRPRQWVVFGGGAHLCLGQHVAVAEAKLLLVLLLRRFEVRLEDPGLLAKASMLPGPKPRKGTDGLLLIPRDLQTEDP
ncbi:hypothetical protein PLESTB_001357200 [Pleodorina starrii]|uniref:Cytochrome P450 n=1 Tax=Pleodorina starrii TaxID=330485 RepID=A0A9W6F6S4_9CHLO|nr:hypothetical protein PLESTM_001917000 [Pleodorina starrii]GLC58424.1 hypothetical protein PLESTB_001357200 [Pleodorina starrii]GLC76480.1 hypothetical protein PLESTF_001785800 [Pleodorina starrii]